MDLPGYNQLKRCREGWMIYNRNDAYLGRSLDIYGEYSNGEVDVFRQVIPAGALVVEVGANIGAHTVALANIAGPHGAVMTFEPQRVLFQTLCGNVALNSIPNAYCRNEAVADVHGAIKVANLDPNQQTSFGSFNLEDFQDYAGETRPVVTLDSLPLPKCDFLKIDVEGMEGKVIAGGGKMIRRHRPILYVENDRDDSRSSLIAAVNALDYALYWHLPPLYNPSNYARNPENVFGHLRSTNMLCIPKERHMPINGLEHIDPAKFES